MSSSRPFRERDLRGPTYLVSVVAVCALIPAEAAHAQMNQRLSVSGYVSPRCWVTDAGSQATQTTRPTDLAAPRVRCSTAVSHERVEQADHSGGLAVTYRPDERTDSRASLQVASRVIISPIP